MWNLDQVTRSRAFFSHIKPVELGSQIQRRAGGVLLWLFLWWLSANGWRKLHARNNRLVESTSLYKQIFPHFRATNKLDGGVNLKVLYLEINLASLQKCVSSNFLQKSVTVFTHVDLESWEKVDFDRRLTRKESTSTYLSKKFFCFITFLFILISLLPVSNFPDKRLDLGSSESWGNLLINLNYYNRYVFSLGTITIQSQNPLPK